MSIYLRIYIIFFMLIIVSSCSSNRKINEISYLSYVKKNHNYTIIKSKNGFSKIHQKNGITIVGKVENGKLNGDVDIVYRDIKDIDNIFKTISITNKKYKSIDDFTLRNIAMFENIYNSDSERVRGVVFTIIHRVKFNNGIMNPYGSLIFQNGLKINTKLKLVTQGANYIKKITANGKSKIILDNRNFLSVNIINNKITELNRSNLQKNSCNKQQVNINESAVYGACINQDIYKRIVNNNISITKKFLRRIKSKSKKMRRVRHAVPAPNLNNQWRAALITTSEKIKEYKKLTRKNENELIGRIYSISDGEVKINTNEFLHAWVIASPIDIHSKKMLNLKGINNLKVEVSSNEDKEMIHFINALVMYSIDVKTIKDIFTKEDKYLEKNVYLLPNYNGSPFSDGMGNLYLPKAHKYSYDELYMIMHHEAVHVSNFSVIEEVLYNNSVYSASKKLLLMLPPDFKNTELC